MHRESYHVPIKIVEGESGNLGFLNLDKNFPFAVKRFFFIYDVPLDLRRGGHTLKTCEQLLVPIKGSIVVQTSNGQVTKSHQLDRPDLGLFLPPMLWRELVSFSDDAILLVLASEFYCEKDYIRTFGEFHNAINKVS